MEMYTNGFDRCYYYNLDHHDPNHTYVKIPLVKKYFTCEEKEPGSILLDHDGEQFNWHKDPHWDWNEKIWNFFASRRDIFPNVWQLERGNVDRPSFIKTIKMNDPEEYLKETSKFEKFICTHAGSYNHTAVDMAIRGTKVFVPFDPCAYHKTFVPRCLVDDLDMVLYKDEKELEELLNRSLIYKPKLDQGTDLDDVVALMDRDFQQWCKPKVLLT